MMRHLFTEKIIATNIHKDNARWCGALDTSVDVLHALRTFLAVQSEASTPYISDHVGL